MKVRKKEARLIKASLDAWKNQGMLNNETHQKLFNDVEAINFDWKRLAKYSFWVAIICLVIAFGAAVADRELLKMLRFIVEAPYVVKFFVLLLTTIGTYWFSINRRSRFPNNVFSNEAFLFLGILCTAGTIYQLGRMLDTGSGHFSILVLLSFLVYGFLGFWFKSKLIWLFSLLSLGGWIGCETGYVSGWGEYYLGMNYPLRFVLFGGTLTMLAFILERNTKLVFFYKTTLVMGLLYLFIALWIMSIFGNYGEINSWIKVKQIELFHWSILFGVVACAAVYHGLKFDNNVTRGFGITFLFINLYTRYFEHFWNATHKFVFFAILGISFWILGSKFERIWNLGRQRAVVDKKS